MSNPGGLAGPTAEASTTRSAEPRAGLSTSDSQHDHQRPRRRLSSSRRRSTSLRRGSTLEPTWSPGEPLTRIYSTHQTVSSLSEDPELPSAPRPPSPPAPEANAPPPAEEVTLSRLTAHYAGLVLASMCGCLIRLGLNALSDYDGSVVYPLLWSQGVGCGIMGLSLARKNEIISIYPPVYTFLTTGIAGSVTTFSSWMLEGYNAFSNEGGYKRSGLHDTVNGLAYSFSTWLVSMAAINVGHHFSTIPPHLPAPAGPNPTVELKQMSHQGRSTFNQQDRRPEDTADSPDSSATATEADRVCDPESQVNDQKSSRLNPLTGATPILDTLTILTAAIAYLIALLVYFLGPQSYRHKAVFSILLSPPGAILRFALGRVNVRSPFLDRFPLGTFIANMVATLVLCGSYVGQRTSSGSMAGLTRCNALYAIQEGFCGCLSTVSTFVVEARAIKGRGWKWVYVGGSVILGHIFALAIVGGTKWSQGLYASCDAPRS